METVQARLRTSLNQLDQIASELDWIDAPPEAYQCITEWKQQLSSMKTVALLTKDQLSQLAFIEHELAMDVS